MFGTIRKQVFGIILWSRQLEQLRFERTDAVAFVDELLDVAFAFLVGILQITFEFLDREIFDPSGNFQVAQLRVEFCHFPRIGIG